MIVSSRKTSWWQMLVASVLAYILVGCAYAEPKHRFFSIKDAPIKTFGVAIRFDVHRELGELRVRDLIHETVKSSGYCSGGYTIDKTVSQGATETYYGHCNSNDR